MLNMHRSLNDIHFVEKNPLFCGQSDDQASTSKMSMSTAILVRA
uniref:Uncharacterized protein n=1 Tax=Anguilla anguilla TaxID=7936 RepID=A0A0E9R6M2_ANGAN